MSSVVTTRKTHNRVAEIPRSVVPLSHYKLTASTVWVWGGIIPAGQEHYGNGSSLQFSFDAAIAAIFACGCSSIFSAASRPLRRSVAAFGVQRSRAGGEEFYFGGAVRLGNENAGGELQFDRAVGRSKRLSRVAPGQDGPLLTRIRAPPGRILLCMGLFSR